MTGRVLTVRQPWADLVMADDGAGGCWKDVENRTWPVPSTLPQWWTCGFCCLPTRRHHRYGHETRYHVHQGTRFEVAGHDGPFPFRLWIHAGKGVDRDAVYWGGITFDPEHRGVLLGSVLMTGCHHADECGRHAYSHDVPPGTTVSHHGYCSRWAEPDVWHWTLTDPQPLDTPIPMRGSQGLWKLDLEEVAA